MQRLSPDQRILEIETFIHFAFGVWPQIRGRHLDSLSRRCRRCIVSEKYAPIREDGVCEECHTHTEVATDAKPNPAMIGELNGILAAHYQTPGAPYDAVVLYSGGKDSTLIVHKLMQEHPRLRLLGLLVDNGFMSNVALENAERGAAMLDLDMVKLKPKKEMFEKTFRHAFRNLNPEGCYTTVDRMDGDLVFDIGRNFTQKLRVPLMIAGLSVEQIEKIMGIDSFESPEAVEQQARSHSAGFDLAAHYSAEECERYWWGGRSQHYENVPRVLYPLYVWRLSETYILKEVVRLNLIEKGKDNPLITNNDTIPVMLAVDYAVLGYSGFEPEFAQMVRLGKSERDAWLNLFQAIEYLYREGRFLPNCIHDTLTRLQLTEQDVGLPPLQLDKALDLNIL